VQYGPRITAVCADLWHGQFLSRNRTCEAAGELFGVPVSLGHVDQAKLGAPQPGRAGGRRRQ
jgi:hypothetical protein